MAAESDSAVLEEDMACCGKGAGSSGNESKSSISTCVVRERERDMDIRVRSARERTWRGFGGEGDVTGVETRSWFVVSGDGGERMLGDDGDGISEIANTNLGLVGEGDSEAISEISSISQDGSGSDDVALPCSCIRREGRALGTGVSCSTD